MDPAVAVALLAAAGLAALWVVHLRRDLDRRRAKSSEWADVDDVGDAEELWTSGARCLRCHSAGALLSREGDVLWHTCMACGHRHRRAHRG